MWTIALSADAAKAEVIVNKIRAFRKSKQPFTASALESCNEAGILKSGRKRARTATKRFIPDEDYSGN